MTAQMSRLHAFLWARQQAGGAAPTFAEMAEAIGIKSTSGLARRLDAMAERGIVRRLRHRQRAVEVLLPPAGAAAPVQPRDGSDPPSHLLVHLAEELAPGREDGLEMSAYAAGVILDLLLDIARAVAGTEARLARMEAPPC